MMKLPQSGDPVNKQLFTDIAKAINSLSRSKSISEGPGGGPWQIRNDSAGTIPQFECLEIIEPAIDPTSDEDAFRYWTVLAGDVPTEGAKHLAICLEAIDAGEVGPCVVAGLSVCKVNVVNDAHEYAQAADGDTLPDTAASGPLSIVWKEDGTGELWALVTIGGCPAAEVVAKIGGNDSDGGHYTGTSYPRGQAIATAGGGWAIAGGASGEAAVIINLDENGLDTHWLEADSWATGIKVGTVAIEGADTAVVLITCGHARTASPATLGASTEGSETASTKEWRRNEVSSGDVYGDCPLKVYLQVRPPVYNHAGDKKLYAFVCEVLIAADGRWVSVGPETRVEVDAAESC